MNAVAAASPVADAPAFKVIPLTSITASKTNPRTVFNKAKLDELAVSIARSGVIEPILVRPCPGTAVSAEKFEIIAGERRFRASVLAKVTDIPCIVKQLDDEQTLELQIIENVQREDLHPLEEARGYRDLIKTFHHTAEDLAQKIGKSTAYIYQRIQLNHLAKPVQKLFEEGELSLGIAQLIARIPVQSVHEELAKRLIQWGSSVNSAKEEIERRYMLDLSEAPFDTKATDLHESAGACVECPKRTGNQKALFADIAKDDYCTDPDCHEVKRKTHVVLILQRAKDAGQTVIPQKEAAKLMPSSYSSEIKGYAPLTDQQYLGNKMTSLKSVLPNGVKPTLLVNPHFGSNHAGQIIEVVPDAIARQAWKDAGLKSSSSSSSSYSAQQREVAAKKKMAEGDIRYVGRLALREEGEFWNAYYAMPNTMAGAMLLGCIRMRSVADPERKAAFMNLMREVVADIIESVVGVRPTWGGEQAAPEHERAGHG